MGTSPIPTGREAFPTSPMRTGLPGAWFRVVARQLEGVVVVLISRTRAVVRPDLVHVVVQLEVVAVRVQELDAGVAAKPAAPLPDDRHVLALQVLADGEQLVQAADFHRE